MKAAITRRRAAPVATAVFLLTAAFVLAKTGRDALYFQMRGVLDLPYAYLAIAALALPFALMRALVRIAEGGLKASIHRASWEQAFLVLPYPTRTSAKLMVDGVGARLAEGATAGALVGLVASRGGDVSSMSVDLGWFTWGLLAAAGTWAFLTHRIGARLPFHHDPANLRMPEACCMTTALGEAAEEENR